MGDSVKEAMEILRQRELDELRRLSDEEERDDIEQRARFYREVDRIKGVDSKPLEEPKEDRIEEEEVCERMRSIDIDGEFILLNPDGSVERVFDNLYTASSSYHIPIDTLQRLVVMRKQLCGKILVTRSEHYKAWVNDDLITFELDPDSMDISSYTEQGERNKKRVKNEKVCNGGVSDVVKKPKLKRAIYCVDTGEYFPSISDASESKCISMGCISTSVNYSCRVKGLLFAPVDKTEIRKKRVRPIGRLASDQEIALIKDKERIFMYSVEGGVLHKPLIVVEETGNVYNGAGPISRLFNIDRKRVLNIAKKEGMSVLGNHIRMLNKEEYGRILVCDDYAEEEIDHEDLLPSRVDSKLIKRLDTGEVYTSVGNFAKAIHVTRSCVDRSISCGMFKAGGIRFEIIGRNTEQ